MAAGKNETTVQQDWDAILDIESKISFSNLVINAGLEKVQKLEAGSIEYKEVSVEIQGHRKSIDSLNILLGRRREKMAMRQRVR